MEAALFAAWADAFNRQNPAVQVGYVPTSSAEGIRRVSLSLGDFGAGEIRLEGNGDDPPHGHLVGIPIAVVGVAPIYNLPGITDLRFTGELLGQIYTGMVVKWNDPRIARLNPGVTLPDLHITAIDRTTGSGIKFIFDEFLSKGLADYRNKRQHPKFTTGGGTELMAQSVALTPGAIGYVAVIPQQHHGVSQGAVRNLAGRFVRGSQSSIYAACAAKAETIEEHLGASMVDASGSESYPMVGFVRLYLPASAVSAERVQALQQFVSWALGEGQQYIGLGLLPLPKSAALEAKAELNTAFR